MFRKVISLSFLIILAIMLVVPGCDNNKDEVQELKIQLAETRIELDKWQRKYEGIALDNARLRANQRSFDTKFDDVDSSARTAEEQLTVAKTIIQELQLENQSLYTTIENQQTLLNQQEADLQELLNMLGLTTDEQVQNGY